MKSIAGNSLPLALAATVCIALAPMARSQQSSGPNLNVAGNEMQSRMELSNMDAMGDRDEIAAFQAFSKENDAAKKIQLGNKFLQKYPKSQMAERVDYGIMNVYRDHGDWKNTYLWGDNALALKPDDVDVLATLSWTIPHVYNPNDSDADQLLDKAEKYAKHALDVLATMVRPAGLTDSQFAAAKARRTYEAHSALGLVYFRRNDYDASAKELRLSTEGNPVQDQTDLYVLGIDFQNLNRFQDAAQAFHGCSQIAGALEDSCRQNTAAAEAQAAKTNSH